MILRKFCINQGFFTVFDLHNKTDQLNETSEPIVIFKILNFMLFLCLRNTLETMLKTEKPFQWMLISFKYLSKTN